MTSKQRMLAALTGVVPDRLPCAPHWWGSYKYEALGLDSRRDPWKAGSDIVPVYEGFFEKFRPDWFHLHIGTPAWFRGASIEDRPEGSRLRIDPGQRELKKRDRYFSFESGDDERIVDFPDYLLGSRADRPKVELRSEASIREYARRFISMDAALITALGYTDHVKALARRYGGEAFIAVHIPSAVCEIFDPITGYTGFEEGLIAVHEEPDGMRRLIEVCYELQLEWARAFAEAGAHAFIISESYLSPDLAGADAYGRFLKAVHREYFAEIARMGLIPMMHYWGDAMAVLEDLAELPVRGLMVEESKKTFSLDVREIRDRLAGRKCVFGNLDSITLMRHGSPTQVFDEAIRQAAGAKGSFVVSNGSPLVPGTPPANVLALIEAASGGGNRKGIE